MHSLTHSLAQTDRQEPCNNTPTPEALRRRRWWEVLNGRLWVGVEVGAVAHATSSGRSAVAGGVSVRTAAQPRGAITGAHTRPTTLQIRLGRDSEGTINNAVSERSETT